jgi:16S rRNA processing protein RimM
MSAPEQPQKHQQDDSGSVDNATEPSFLIIGQITKPHGVRGDVRVMPYTELPERFTWLERVYVGETNPQPVAVESARLHQNMVLLKLAGTDNRQQAEALRGQWLLVPEAEALPLAEGEYYLYQLEGLQVFTEDGRFLGTLTNIIETKANNVFVVNGEQGEILLPDISDVVQEIDFENGRIIVNMLPGL